MSRDAERFVEELVAALAADPEALECLAQLIAHEISKSADATAADVVAPSGAFPDKSKRKLS
jgi:hypothetical protein